MSLKTILLLLAILTICGETVLACHKGGPMGFASNDPGGFSLDITLSPTFIGASTSGSVGCKEWNYAQHQRQHFLETQWSFLTEEAAQGKGENLIALANLMGCTKEREVDFAAFVRNNYSSLFAKTKAPSDLITQFELLISQNSEFTCSG